MRKLSRRLMMAAVGTIVGVIAGGISVYLFLGVLRGFFADEPLYIPNFMNSLVWILSIGIGIGSLIVGCYLGQFRWKFTLEKGDSLQALMRVSTVGALVGIGVTLSWFTLSQIGLALLVSYIQRASVP